MRWGAEDYSSWEAKRLRRWQRQRLLLKVGFAAAFLAAFGAAWKFLPQSMDFSHIYSQWSQERQARERSVYYPNCDAARAAGVAPIHRGQPGYRQELDGDYDDVACEPIPSWAR